MCGLNVVKGIDVIMKNDLEEIYNFLLKLEMTTLEIEAQMNYLISECGYTNHARILEELRRQNKQKLDKLKKRFVKVLEREMQKKYREIGIDGKIEIQTASVTAGCVNVLTLELKGENLKKYIKIIHM